MRLTCNYFELVIHYCKYSSTLTRLSLEDRQEMVRSDGTSWGGWGSTTVQQIGKIQGRILHNLLHCITHPCKGRSYVPSSFHGFCLQEIHRTLYFPVLILDKNFLKMIRLSVIIIDFILIF